MLAERIIAASFVHSPIGFIPNGYPFFQKLCSLASIRFSDETIVREEKKATYRNWSIVADPKPAVDARGVTRGKSSTNFHKFCMLLDYLENQNPNWSRIQILDEAVQRNESTTRTLMLMPWRKMNDQLAVMGIKSYEILRTKRKKDADLPDF